MESNPVTILLSFWMMLQLFAMLALLAGGIYLMYCLGRAASGLDRMASAMEDWVAIQNQNQQNQTLPSSRIGSTPSAGATAADAPPIQASIATSIVTPFAPAAPQSPQDYSQLETKTSDETQRF